jgi:hypothetical protein
VITISSQYSNSCGAGFSLWVLVAATIDRAPTNPHRLKPVLLNSTSAICRVAERADQEWHVVVRPRVSHFKDDWNV